MNYNTPNQMNYYPTPNYNPQMPYPNTPSISYSQPQVQQPMMSGLNGKIVDSEEMVRATEVPIGSYGIFPKADMSEVFIKTWNPNGTTNIIHYKPAASDESQLRSYQPMIEDHSDKIIDRIEQMEMKIEELFKEQKKDKKVNLGEF